MGRRLAGVLASGGLDVRLTDSQPDVLGEATATAQGLAAARAADRGTSAGTVQAAPALDEAVGGRRPGRRGGRGGRAGQGGAVRAGVPPGADRGTRDEHVGAARHGHRRTGGRPEAGGRHPLVEPAGPHPGRRGRPRPAYRSRCRRARLGPAAATSASSRCWSTRTSPASSATGCSTHCGARRSPSSPRGSPTPRPSTWSCATRSACAWARWARSRTPTTWASTSPSPSTTRCCPVLTARPSPTRCCVTSLRQETSAPRPARGSCGGLRASASRLRRRLAAHVAAQLSRPSD